MCHDNVRLEDVTIIGDVGKIITQDSIDLRDCYIIHKDMMQNIEHKLQGVMVITTKPRFD